MRRRIALRRREDAADAYLGAPTVGLITRPESINTLAPCSRNWKTLIILQLVSRLPSPTLQLLAVSRNLKKLFQVGYRESKKHEISASPPLIPEARDEAALSLIGARSAHSGRLRALSHAATGHQVSGQMLTAFDGGVRLRPPPPPPPQLFIVSLPSSFFFLPGF